MSDPATAFPTWEALRKWVEDTYTEVTCFGDNEHIVRFVLADGDTREGIGMRYLEAKNGAIWVYLGVKVCKATQLPATAALAVGFELPVGSMAVGGDFLMFGQKLPLTSLTSAFFQETLAELMAGMEAIRARTTDADPKQVQATFSHFAE